MSGSKLRDRALAEDIRATLSRDSELCRWPVEFTVIGGVVHTVAPDVPPNLVDQLRTVIGRHRGVHGVWVRTRSPEFRCVEVGCGRRKQWDEALGVDLLRTEAVDLRADLDGALPFRDASIDCLFAVHVIEHLPDLFAAMDEMHRVLKPQGMLHVMVPEASSVNAVADPTHVRFFNTQSFKYFCMPQARCRPWYPWCISCDGASVFADLRPLPPGAEPASDEQLARFFD